MSTVNLGDEVKDSVSDFTGTVVALHLYLNGCTRVSVQPKVNKDGTLPDAQSFDEPQLVVTKSRRVPEGPRNTGGPAKYMPGKRPE
jgi:hypothetical protein